MKFSACNIVSMRLKRLKINIFADEFSETALSTYSKKVNEEVGYDFALSNLLVQFPRNKTLTKVWMKILTVLIARAKEDKEYADIIAGIFEGTYPSYKALTVPFILKSLKQGGLEISKELSNSLKHPNSLLDNGADSVQFLFKILEEIKADPVAQLKWAGNTLSKTASVAAHLAQTVDLSKIRKGV
ncbi:hypothetical protein O4H26_09520 [Aequorivita viscosa]|nr:hypothetical protein [Aequorivita viscosa]